ncbi:DAK2 domain-containing protein, partial [Chloroflexota bacterium]
IILPNNKNVVATANQVQGLTKKTIKIVPTTTVPQGVAALLAFDYEADLNANVQLMQKAIDTVKTVEVTRAVRSTKINGLKIKKKQPIGLLDGELMAAGSDFAELVLKMLGKLDLEKAEVFTIYYGHDTELAEAEGVSNNIRETYPQLQIEVVAGGQPHYNYIISIE